jgi:hypothetical protein
MSNTEKTKPSTQLVGRALAAHIQAEQTKAQKQVEALQQRIEALQKIKGRPPGYYKKMMDDIIEGKFHEAKCGETIDALVHFSHEYGAIGGQPNDQEISGHLVYIFEMVYTSTIWSQLDHSSQARLFHFLKDLTNIIHASMREWHAVQALEYADVYFRPMD